MPDGEKSQKEGSQKEGREGAVGERGENRIASGSNFRTRGSPIGDPP